MSAKRRVLIMAGGTGGHVFPALAVANSLRARNVDVHWLGTSTGIEARVVPANDIPLHVVKVAGIRGKGFKSRLQGIITLFSALRQTLCLLRQLKPDAVVGFGGYASGPGGLAARLLGKPLVIHEQNAIAGTTNRILSRIATRVMEAFPGALPEAVCTGNPVRNSITLIADPERRQVGQHKPLRLLVLGGSLGALAINQLVPAALALLAPEARPAVRHQCGADHVDITRSAYQSAGVEAEVEPFIEDMATAYSWADYVICRAGALTVSELAAAGVGALLIPFPAAIDDHQTRNAQWLSNQGAAVLVQQRDLDPQRLAELLNTRFTDAADLQQMATASRKLARLDAADQVAAACQEVMA